MLYFDDPAAATSLTLFPNPAAGYITARLPNDFVGQSVVVNVYSTAGAVLRSEKRMPLGATDVRIPLTGLAAGTYYIQAATDNRSEYGRFVKAGD